MINEDWVMVVPGMPFKEVRKISDDRHDFAELKKNIY